MSEYFKIILRGTEIIFGENQTKIDRKKLLDTKKEIRLANNIRKTSILQRGSNRVQKIVSEASNWVEEV